jgi:hypothetical protein
VAAPAGSGDQLLARKLALVEGAESDRLQQEQVALYLEQSMTAANGVFMPSDLF